MYGWIYVCVRRRPLGTVPGRLGRTLSRFVAPEEEACVFLPALPRPPSSRQRGSGSDGNVSRGAKKENSTWNQHVGACMSLSEVACLSTDFVHGMLAGGINKSLLMGAVPCSPAFLASSFFRLAPALGRCDRRASALFHSLWLRSSLSHSPPHGSSKAGSDR